MDPSTALLLQLMGLVTMAAIWLYFKAKNEVRRFYLAQAASLEQKPPSQMGEPADAQDLTPIPGAGHALATPPQSLRVVLANMRRNYPDLRFGVPFGWVTDGRIAGVVCADLVGDVYHMLITAQSRGGKDTLATTMLLALTQQQPPERLQFCLIDGKGLDFAGWDDKAYTWRLALDPEEIRPTMLALSAERKRRAEVLRAARVSKWENYCGSDLPLLVVYVSELSLLEDAVGKNELASWLNSELAAGAAFGIRYIIATQTASNFPTRWRSQIGLYLAGYQPSASQDQPNTGLTTKEIRDAGGVPPSELPAPPTGAGVFTAIQGRQCWTVRASYLDDIQRQRWLDSLPIKKHLPAPVSAPHSAPQRTEEDDLQALLLAVEQHPQAGTKRAHQQSAAEEQEAVAAVAPEVPADERRAILELARAGLSRRKIALQLYGGMGKYDRVKMVLDEHEDLAGAMTPAA